MASTRSAMQQQKPPLRIFEQPDAAAVSHMAGVKPPGPPESGQLHAPSVRAQYFMHALCSHGDPKT